MDATTKGVNFECQHGDIPRSHRVTAPRPESAHTSATTALVNYDLHYK